MKLDVCRLCHNPDLELILTLGCTPLANSLLMANNLDKKEAKYPLELVFCHKCSLVQIAETVPPEKLFRDYMYFSSVSHTMLRHCESLVNSLIASKRLTKNSLVIEIASNDGYLLQYYVSRGIPVLGIEPALNVAKIAQEHGINTTSEFFGRNLAINLKAGGKQADIIHANNVLAHVADLNGFVSGIATLLKESGVAVIEVPYVVDLIDRLAFDTIYHEHLCYFSVATLKKLFERNGLFLLDVSRIPLHGGSLQLYVGKNGEPTQRVTTFLQIEEQRKINNCNFYRAFSANVTNLKSQLIGLLANLKSIDKRIAAYGASAKGSTLLNFCGIGSETIDFVVDRSIVKQGCFTPGTHLPIYDPDKLLQEMPDYVLLLSWNLVHEILEQQQKYVNHGGKFIMPLPKPKIIDTYA